MTVCGADGAPAPRPADLDDQVTPSVFVVGAGLVGGHLAGCLRRGGVPVLGMHGRPRRLAAFGSGGPGVLRSEGEYPETLALADVVVVAVRDLRVPEVAERLAREGRLSARQILLHVGGIRAAGEALAAARGHVAAVGTMHPLAAVTDAPGAADNLARGAFGIEGDEAARVAAARLVRAMGGRPMTVPTTGMALYHAGAVMASSYAVVLADLARGALVAAGIDPVEAGNALAPLLASAARNVVEVGVPAALTGPLVRGDVASIERHLAALGSARPELVGVYKRLGIEALRIARAKLTAAGEDLDAATVSRLAALLG